MVRTHRSVLALLVLALSSAMPAQAQTVLLQPGVHVRLIGIGDGVIAQRSTDSLYIFTKGHVATVPLKSLATIEVRGPRDRGKGARKGALIGGASMAVFGAISWAAGDSASCRWYTETGHPYDCDRKFNAADAALVAAGGAMLGAGVGWLLGPRTWHTVQLTAYEIPRPAMLPQRRIALSIRVR